MTIDELDEYGIVRMGDDEIDGFLSSQRVGVLGLATDGPPSMRPLSFWYDGDARLYFLYVVGSESRKATLTKAADAARFLVYRTETGFNWRSVLLTGTIDATSGEPGDAVLDGLSGSGRPDAVERATEREDTLVVRFDITDWAGYKHLGLPPGLDSVSSGDEDSASDAG
jgi:hypothetical protein